MQIDRSAPAARYKFAAALGAIAVDAVALHAGKIVPCSIVRHSQMVVEVYTAGMKKSLKAGLLSGLLFPGLGHFAVGAYRRGTVLLLVSAAALWKTISIAVA
ncbi:MAG: hypothetical protein RIA65_04045, partial [Woeseia sp.]